MTAPVGLLIARGPRREPMAMPTSNQKIRGVG